MLRWRWQVIVIYAVLTAFFSVGVMRIASRFQAQTSVADLIPAHNRVTDVFKRYQSFSKPATVEILLKVMPALDTPFLHNVKDQHHLSQHPVHGEARNMHDSRL